MVLKFYLDRPQPGVTPAKQKPAAIWLKLVSGRIAYTNKQGAQADRANYIKFHTGQRILPHHWNSSTQRVKPSAPGSMQLNHLLDSMQEEVKSLLRKLADIAPSTDLESVREPVKQIIAGKDFRQVITDLKKQDEHAPADFFHTYSEFLSLYQGSRTSSTVAKHRRNIDLLKAFVINPHKAPPRKPKQKKNAPPVAYPELVLKRTILFDAVTVEFLERWVQYLQRHAEFTNNTAAKAVALTNTFLNWAAKRRYHTNLQYKDFATKGLKKETDLIALSEAELMHIYYLDLADSPYLARVRDVFCFSAFTGQRFSDVAALRPEHIKGSTWQLRVKKTTDVNRVPLNSFALAILARHPEGLPVVSNQKTNDYLKVLGRRAGITEPTTVHQYRGAEVVELTGPKHTFMATHTARRTFATLMLKKGMLPEMVRRIGGWKDYRSFEKYIRLTDQAAGEAMELITWSAPAPQMTVAV